jgi:hypothetical protein
MQWMKTGFVGYGRFADLWLYGMEEHCRSDEDAARRLALLPSFPLTMGLTEAHHLYGFNALPPDVAVWNDARDLATACGLRATNVGETDGDVLLAELLPLPRRTNDARQWPSIYTPLFPDYARYKDAGGLPPAASGQPQRQAGRPQRQAAAAGRRGRPQRQAAAVRGPRHAVSRSGSRLAGMRFAASGSRRTG